MKRRVVVTGLGVVSPLGCNVQSAWKKLLSGGNGICKLNSELFANLPCRIAACVKKGSNEGELNLEKYFSKAELRNISPASHFALVACEEALTDSKWHPQDRELKARTGVCIGMGMIDLVNVCEAYEALKKGYSRVSPYFVPRILPNMAAGYVSIKYGFQGPNHTVSTACTTGCHSIGDAFKFIQHGMADVMVCGGTEASINPLSIAGFCRLRALSVGFNDCPDVSSRPFDAKRDGFVMGEGAAILILEELEHAINRDAKIYAEVVGYGLSADAFHITAPHSDGEGAVLAMKRALQDAEISPDEISYVNAHATSTPLGDAIELKAIKSVFPNTSNLCVSSTKGAHGHLLGAAGNLESLFTVLACYHSQLPPTINLDNICEEGAGINFVANIGEPWVTSKKKIALKNSFGFGGTNGCLCLSEYISR